MIIGTILLSKATPTVFGLQYEVKWDKNPAAKSASGLQGYAIAPRDAKYIQGDRVVLQYQSTSSYGAWFINGKAKQ